MTTLDSAAHHILTATTWGDRFSVLATRVSAWNDARVTRRMLSRLSARELDDIGLSRADIDAAARSR